MLRGLLMVCIKWPLELLRKCTCKYNTRIKSSSKNAWNYLLHLYLNAHVVPSWNWSFVCLLQFLSCHVRANFSFCSFIGMTMVCSLAACTVIELFSMWNLTRVEVHLCNILSPEAPQLSLASYNWGLVNVYSLLFRG